MAENKKSFVLYADLIHTVKKMKPVDAGELLLHILQFVNGENPTTDNIVVDLTFEPIKQQFKRDLKKWEVVKEKRSQAGKLGGRPKIEDLEKQTEAKKANAFSEKQTEAKKAVTVNVNDNVTVNVNDILLEKETKEITEDSNLQKNEIELGKSTVKEILTVEKEKNIAPKKESKFDFRSKLIEAGYLPHLVDEWLRIRLKKKAINSEHAFNTFQTEVGKTGKPPNEVLEIIVHTSRQWKGFEASWLNNINQNYNQNNGNYRHGNSEQSAEKIGRTDVADIQEFLSRSKTGEN